MATISYATIAAVAVIFILAAVLVVGLWVTALAGLISDGSARERLTAGALGAARGPYSWRDAARATLALYREIAR